jgi:hypothetical protein
MPRSSVAARRKPDCRCLPQPRPICADRRLELRTNRPERVEQRRRLLTRVLTPSPAGSLRFWVQIHWNRARESRSAPAAQS